MEFSMHDRLVSHAQLLMSRIFDDADHLYRSEKSRARDRERLQVAIKSRGLKALALDLPSLAKHFDRCLDTGLFTRSDLPFSKSGKRYGGTVPLFLGEVYLRVFHEDGRLRDDADPDAVLFIRTVYLTFKKVRVDCGQVAKDEAIKSFFELESQIRVPSLAWGADSLADDPILFDRRRHFGELSDSESHRWPLRLLQSNMDILATQLGLPPSFTEDGDPSAFLPKHGPGVVSDISSRSSKYEFRNWPTRLQHEYPHDYWASPNLGYGLSDREEGVTGIDYPSRLICVPKTLDKPRLIACEPSYNQWIQQLLWAVLADRLEATFLASIVKFRDQTQNGNMARLGSKTAALATIDLSEASDRLSCYVVERALRANPLWLVSMNACRTPLVSYPGKTSTAFVKLRKFAPMGSAVTFPLQSIVYAVVAVTACQLAGISPSRGKLDYSGQVSVFGDDIIVPTQALPVAVELLTLLGLKVNTSKTYSGMNFRESCGVEAFRGYDVSVPRVYGAATGKPGEIASDVEVSNNFFKAGFWKTADFLRDLLPQQQFIPVARSDSFPIRLYTFCEGCRAPITRYSKQLHRMEAKVLIVRSRPTYGRMSPTAKLLSYFTEKPKPTIKWKAGVVVDRTSQVRQGWVPVHL